MDKQLFGKYSQEGVVILQNQEHHQTQTNFLNV